MANVPPKKDSGDSSQDADLACLFYHKYKINTKKLVVGKFLQMISE